MTRKIRLYLKTRRNFDSEELELLKQEVLQGTSEDITFDIIVGLDTPKSIDWSRYRSEPPKPLLEARFLSQEIQGIEVCGGGNFGANSNKSLIPAKTVINWIRHMKNELPPVISEVERFEEHLFDVHDTWKHGSEELVYKYCTWDTAKKHILSDKKTIQLSDILTLNDPLEFSSISVPLYGASDDDPLKYWSSINKVTREGVKYFCCTRDVASNFNEVTGYMNQSAIRGFAHPAMWNHYANSHEGVCLVFRKNHLNRAISDALSEQGHLLSSNVKYWKNSWAQEYDKDLFPMVEGIDKWSKGQLHLYLTNKTIEHREELFFSKIRDWEYENEFRWVFIGKEKGSILVPFNDALAGVILGCDFDNKFHKDAAKLAQENSVPIRRIWWRNGYAVPPWPLEAFEKGDTLEKWSEQAAFRRKNRSKTKK